MLKAIHAQESLGRRVHPSGAQVVDDRSRLLIGRFPALLGMDSLSIWLTSRILVAGTWQKTFW
jgi:hypothetical protein